jgi:hypothetical protein
LSSSDVSTSTTESTSTSTTSPSTTSSTISSSSSTSTSTSTTSPSTSSTSTTIATTISSGTTLQPCGYFAKYDPNSPGDLASKGFLGAESLTYKYYVGFGNLTCGVQGSIPGFIYGDNLPLLKKRGVYSSCKSLLTSEIFDDKSAYYLLNHPNLAYVQANSTSLWSVPNTLRLNSTEYVYFFGRTSSYLGKVRNQDKSSSMAAMYYLLPITNLEMITTQFDVLTCKP